MSEVETEATAVDAPALNQSEVMNALRALTARQKAMVMSYARNTARKYNNPALAQDLIQEAYKRALSGQRTWRSDLSVESFLMGCIRGIASDWHKKSRRERLIEEDEDFGDNNSEAQSNDARLDIARIIALFDDDPIAMKIVQAMAEGLEGEEIQRVCGLSGVKYQNKRRFMRRRLNKFVGDGGLEE